MHNTCRCPCCVANASTDIASKSHKKFFRCYEQSILEIWDFDRDIIFNLTQADILDAINTLTVR